MMPVIAVGAGPGVMIRKVWPRSTEPNQVLRCVPVPVGPLLKTRPCGSTARSGSPLVVGQRPFHRPLSVTSFFRGRRKRR